MGFIERPQLVEGVIFHLPRGDEPQDVIVLTGTDSFLLPRAVFDKLAPLLTGEHTLHQLTTLLKGALPAPLVIATVQTMAKHHAVFDAASPGGESRATTDLGAASIAIQRAGEADVAGLSAALAGAGLRECTDGEADATIVVTDHYLRDELPALNRAATSPWLPVRPSGRELWIGPLIVPGETACWECLAQRLRLNSKMEQFVARETDALPIPRTTAVAQPPGARAIAFAMAAQWVRDGLGGKGQAPRDTLVAVDPASLTVTHHHVVRRPQCAVCGADQPVSPAPLELKAGVPAPSTPNDRDAAARETLDRYSYHISPITGLLPELRPQSRSAGIHVYGGGPYMSRPPTSFAKLMETLDYRAAGKGVTQATAKASALAETLEWYTLCAQESGALVIDSYERLSARARAIPPTALTQFSAAQYADRDQINRDHVETKYHVPPPFDPEVAFGWINAWSLTREEWAFVPAGACSVSHPCPFMRPNSNGNAAGATLEEAILHGALEAIERDAIALWWYNYARRPAVSLDGVEPGLVGAMREHYRRAGQDFWLLDITSDLGIPVMAAVSIGKDQTWGHPIIGFGAHFDPHVAATRALTELNQFQPCLGDVVPREDRPVLSPGDNTDGPLPPQIFPRQDAPPRTLAEMGSHHVEDARDGILRLVDTLRAFGFEMLVADLTLPDVRLPVVKALIPGLCHIYPELGPGRLHDVPLAQGWIDAPVAEAQMRVLRSPL